MKSSWGKFALITANVFVYGVLVAPLVIVVATAFTAGNDVRFPPSGLSMRWFEYVLDRREFVDAFYISAAIAACASVVSLGVGMLASMALVRHSFVGKTVAEALFMSPLILPTVMLGVALLQFFTLLGYKDAFTRLVLGHIIITTPYAIRSISSSLYGFDRSLEEASRVMGANQWKTFRTILLPLIKPGIVAAAIFAFITSFDNLTVSLFLISSRTVTLPIRIMTYLEFQFDPSVGAISTVLIALTFIVLLLLERAVGLGRIKMVSG